MSTYMNLNVTYDLACKEFSEKSPVEMAWKSQAEFDKDRSCFYLPFYSDKLIVTYPEGEVKNAERREEVNITEKILVLHYLINSQGAPLTDRWIAFREIPGGSIYMEAFKGRSFYSFLGTFGNNQDAFEKAALSLGGKKRNMGDISFEIPVFSMVPVIYILWLGDEEIGPSVNILFNESAPYYLPTEDYAVIGSLTSGKLKKSAPK